jgi:hypothetical protein
MVAGPAAPNPSGLPGFNARYGVKANPGGGNANASQLTGWLNTVTQVATAADSVMLPPAYAGAEITVVNEAAVALQVFGYMNTAPGDIVTDTVAPPGSVVQGTAGASVAAGTVMIFFCIIGQGAFTNGITPGQWVARSLS